MNRVKYYQEQDYGRHVEVRVTRVNNRPSWTVNSRSIVSEVDARMAGKDFTRRRPSSIKPHIHPHQQPGYRQPSEQQRRRARQLLKGDRRP